MFGRLSFCPPWQNCGKLITPSVFFYLKPTKKRPEGFPSGVFSFLHPGAAAAPCRGLSPGIRGKSYFTAEGLRRPALGVPAERAADPAPENGKGKRKNDFSAFSLLANPILL